MRHPQSAEHGERDPFLSALRTSRLLSAKQLEQVEADLIDQPGQSQEIAELLILRDWLTPFQVEQIFSGRGELLRLGQYRLLDRLSDKSQGQVYKAEHVLMKRTVALKIISEPSDKPQTPSAVLPVPTLSFLREVQAAARLNHPHIVTAHDAGEDRGRLFLIMELVEGIDLHQLVNQRGSLPVGLACELIRQTAEGLHYAHQRGMVHRDVKPANLMVTLEGTDDPVENLRALREIDWPISPDCYPLVKILDLGLACMVSRATGRAEEDQLVGTPDYLAPELAETSPAGDIRADIYSLGCSFYQILSGQMPYPGGTWTEKIYRHRFDPVPKVNDTEASVPEEIATFVETMMAKDPNDRPATPKEVCHRLETWLARRGSPEHAPTLPTGTEPPPTPASKSKVELSAPVRMRSIVLAVAIGLALSVVAHLALSNFFTPPPASITRSTPERKREQISSARAKFSLGKSVFPSLSEAIQAAEDGDRISIESEEAIRLPPISWQDKALTIVGSSPTPTRLVFASEKAEHPWQALLTTNRSLTLINLDLSSQAPNDSARPLLRCTDGVVRLEKCRIQAQKKNSPLIFTNVDRVEVIASEIHAHSGALSLEVGVKPEHTLLLSACRIVIHHPTGPVATVWAPDQRSTRRVKIDLTGNRIQTGRLLAFTALPEAQIALKTENNHVNYRRALMSFTGFLPRFNPATSLRWSGAKNEWIGPTPPVLIEGELVDLKH